MSSARTKLQPYVDEHPLLSQALVDSLADGEWDVNANRLAATLLHLQLESRISTQELGYSSGSEASALASMHALFERTRVICEQQADAWLFHAVVWHVLNVHVRPFTSRWHRRQGLGRLDALDDTDDFRLELAALRRTLGNFDRLLLEMRGEEPRASMLKVPDGLREELALPLPWGPAVETAGSTDEDGSSILDDRQRAERLAIQARRRRYGIDGCPDRATGLALSGGGIRSATFALGVVSALARRGLLSQFDYLSTVSGGGYLGAFVTGLLSDAEASAEAAKRAEALSPEEASTERERVREPFVPGDREASLLGHIRQNCRYLAAAPLSERLLVTGAQIGGLVTNLMALAALLFLAAGLLLLAEVAWTALTIGDGSDLQAWSAGEIASLIAAGIAALGLLVSQIVAARSRSDSVWADRVLGVSAVPLIIVGFVTLFTGMRRVFGALADLGEIYEISALTLPLVAMLVGLAAERVVPRGAFVGRVAARLGAPLFLLALFLESHRLLVLHPDLQKTALLVAPLVVIWLSLLLNLNFTGLHRHYRRRLAETFVIRPDPAGGVKQAAVRLADLARDGRGPYPILNAALNVPASRRPEMRGRLTDFFSFTPDHCGSPITGYWATSRVEAANQSLDLASAMAISGAAVSPRMGLQNRPGLGFWLSLLNLRLGYWLRRPPEIRDGGAPVPTWRPPALRYLLKELVGQMDERAAFLNLSDGGHIENLGVYELLRRRCKLIVAVDGEQDPEMTFHAVANLQRLAAIDLGVSIDLDLSDLRIDSRGFSRSHFQFCRIHYGKNEIGYLLYLKLSLTGNEGEFLRRFRLDEPAFPHHPTADQNFSEARFEAYRSLGQHVGERLFGESLVGGIARHEDVNIDSWFGAMARSFLDPLVKEQGA